MTSPAARFRLPEIIAVQRDQASKRPSASARGAHLASDILSLYRAGGPRYRLDRHTFAFAPPFAILAPEGTLDLDLQRGRVDGIFVLFRSHGLLQPLRRGRHESLVHLGDHHIRVPLLKPLTPDTATLMSILLEDIGRSHARGTTAGLRTTALLCQAIALYCEAASDSAVHREAGRLRETLERRAFESVSLGDLYRELRLSPTYAERLFKTAYGITPVAFRLSLRMKKARELLASSALNVAETSRTVGIPDPLYFSRLFRKVYGLAPSALIRDFSGRRLTAPARSSL